MRPRPVIPLAAVVVVAAVTACGGGSGRVSKAEMIRRADRVCVQGLRDADRLRSKAVPGARGKDAAAEVDATLTVLNRQIDAFAGLRGPASTDAARATAVRALRKAAAGIVQLRDLVVRDELTVNEAVEASPDLVGRINTASAQANDALVQLGFFRCVAAPASG